MITDHCGDGMRFFQNFSAKRRLTALPAETEARAAEARIVALERQIVALQGQLARARQRVQEVIAADLAGQVEGLQAEVGEIEQDLERAAGIVDERDNAVRDLQVALLRQVSSRCH